MPSRPPLLTTPVAPVPIILPDPAPAVPEGPLRALVVDDEPRLRQVLVRLMRRDGFECADAANGAEAVAQLERAEAAGERFSIVMSDLRMPEMDGVELLRRVRERWSDVAVVMITAVSDVDTAVSCLAMGAMDYLTKPFHLEEVRARVRQALEKRRLLLENREYQHGLERRIAEQGRRIEQLFLASMQSLADALEVKDPYTRGHSVRVSFYAVAIANALGLEAEVVRQIELGGHLHDIGKIGVRESVLNKEGPLTDVEYAHIMTHPMVGWRLLQPLLKDMPLALHIVRSHHERMDGRGVPDHLSRGAIPLEARIVAVADSFDAMTSDRPYRRGLSMDAAIAELRRCAGRQYDPAVVAAFDAAVEAGEISLGA
jgi:putative two-component system response regulator